MSDAAREPSTNLFVLQPFVNSRTHGIAGSA
jgi:hypothetical protein